MRTIETPCTTQDARAIPFKQRKTTGADGQIRRSRRRASARRPFSVLAILFALRAAGQAHGAPPTQWTPRGLGGGGALYGISFEPAGNDIFLACDMSQMLRSNDSGATWDVVSESQIQANQRTVVRYTSDPVVMYAGDSSVFARGGFAPRKSTDGGQTWLPLGQDPTVGKALAIHVDFVQPDRLLVADDTSLYFSNDGGQQFTLKHSAVNPGPGLFVGGAVFDGSDIYVGTNDGLLVSHDDGASFQPESTPGIPAGELPGVLAGSRDGNGLVLVVATYSGLSKALWQSLIHPNYVGLYRLDQASGTWTPASAGLGANVNLSWLAMAGNDSSTAYALGYDPTARRVHLYKSTDGAASWIDTLLSAGNQNIETGWSGEPAAGLHHRWWGDWDTVPNFLAVSPVDANVVGFDDGGFLHTSHDGGATWQAVYVPPGERNSMGSAVSSAEFFGGNGLENTVAHSIAWLDDQTLLTAYSDIQGARSLDGGQSWAPYNTDAGTTAVPGMPDGLKDFSQILVDAASGTVYASASAVGPLYRPPLITDSYLDASGGHVVFSTDDGASWQGLHDFGHPVAAIAFDPTTPNRMYAGVVHHSVGGVQVSDDIQSGSLSTWAPVAAAAHPRMEGHPQDLHVLDDGTVVATFSARQPTAGGGFTNSSGVFVLPPGAAQWEDRSDPGMLHYTRHLTIDPHVGDQGTWYVGTFDSWNNGSSNIAGGLYRTTDWGGSWQQIWDQPVETCTVSPTDPDEMYVTTDRSGLWYTSDLTAPQPTFTKVTSYPFRAPERVFFRSTPTSEVVWITSFGNGIRVGTTGTTCSSGILAQKPRLSWKTSPDRLAFSGQAILSKPWIGVDPLTSGLRLIVNDASTPVLDADVPPGSAWSVNARGDRWTYRDPVGSVAGVTSVVVTDQSKKQDGLLKWVVRGRPVGATPPDAAQTSASLRLGDESECVTVAWNPAGQPKPACRSSAAGLRCR